jgi:putative DNA primase/helicase
VAAATAAFRVESDPLGRFAEACLAPHDGGRVQSSMLYRLYQAWCVANGEKAWSATGFGRALSERGFRRKQSNVMWWLDVAMAMGVSDFVMNFEAPPERWQACRHDGGPDGGGAGGDLIGGGGGDGDG